MGVQTSFLNLYTTAAWSCNTINEPSYLMENVNWGILIFGADNSSARFPYNKNNDFLVLGSVSIHFNEDKTAYPEAKF